VGEGRGAAGAAGAAGPRLEINRASAAELERLPGIGPALARRIVAYRDTAGPFQRLEELDRVPGIGPAILARLAPLLRFPS
jgi:competence protein ComEA